jgi:hypothetical protein
MRSAALGPIAARIIKRAPRPLPFASTSIRSDDGRFGKPGIVMISPQTKTMNSAPAASRTSRTLMT